LWHPSRTTLLIAGGAFLLGLLLFLVLWMKQRGNQDFYRAPVAPTSRAPVFAPLPVPLPAGEQPAGASGLEEPDEEALAQRPQIIEQAPPPPVPAPAPAPQPVTSSGPVPVSSPSPRYPQEALRRRESGRVMVRVEVGPDGVPTATSLVESSQSRSLDRAALDAVKRWRFRPAVADGQATAGNVVVPIEFNLDH
jgi:protein TonB